MCAKCFHRRRSRAPVTPCLSGLFGLFGLLPSTRSVVGIRASIAANRRLQTNTAATTVCARWRVCKRPTTNLTSRTSRTSKTSRTYVCCHPQIGVPLAYRIPPTHLCVTTCVLMLRATVCPFVTCGNMLAAAVLGGFFCLLLAMISGNELEKLPNDAIISFR